MPWLLKLIIGFISRKVRRQAEKLGVGYSFLFMKANGQQLSEITKLVEQGVIKPVLDKVYRFEEMNQAFDYVNSGRARGKVVVQVK
ncbi:zinc-binding dehydrogenase [Flavobacterium sp. MMS24-S5]